MSITPDDYPLPLNHPLYAWANEGWCDDMLDLVAHNGPIKHVKVPVARPGSLWLSVSTKRRASVSWATTTHVKLSFTDHSSKVHSKEAFLRLYSPAK